MGYILAKTVAYLMTFVGLAAALLGGCTMDAWAGIICGAILFVGGMILCMLVDIREVLIAHTRRAKDKNQ